MAKLLAPCVQIVKPVGDLSKSTRLSNYTDVVRSTGLESENMNGEEGGKG